MMCAPHVKADCTTSTVAYALFQFRLLTAEIETVSRFLHLESLSRTISSGTAKMIAVQSFSPSFSSPSFPLQKLSSAPTLVELSLGWHRITLASASTKDQLLNAVPGPRKKMRKGLMESKLWHFTSQVERLQIIGEVSFGVFSSFHVEFPVFSHPLLL